MSNTLKLAVNNQAATGDWAVVYQCPLAKTAVVKSLIVANDAAHSSTQTVIAGVRRGGSITVLTGSTSLTTTAAINMLAGTLSLGASDELVVKTNVAGYRSNNLGDFEYMQTNGAGTIIATRTTGAYRSTDNGTTWTQVIAANLSTRTITYSSGTWVIGANTTSVYISTDDGLTWSTQSITQSSGGISGTQGGYLKVGSTFYGLASNQIASSTNGINWSINASNINPRNLAYNGTLYIAASSGTKYYTSTDCAAWTAYDVPGGASSAYSIFYGNGLFILIRIDSTTFHTSPDGITWTSGTLPSVISQPSAVYANSTWVMIDKGSSTTNLTSTDGITWTSRTITTGTKTDLVFGSGLFVCAISGATTALSSPDGITWTSRTLPSASTWNRIASSGTRFVLMATGTTAASSTDGITWTSRTLSTSCSELIWTGSYFLAYGNTTSISGSTDGTSWNTGTAPYSTSSYTVNFYDGTRAIILNNSGTSCFFTNTRSGNNPVFTYGNLPTSMSYLTYTGTHWITSDNTTTYRSSDSNIWSVISTGLSTGITNLVSNMTGTVIQTASGTPVISTNHGANWSSLSQISGNTVNYFNGKFYSLNSSTPYTLRSSNTGVDFTWNSKPFGVGQSGFNLSKICIHSGKLFIGSLISDSLDLDATEGLDATASVMEVQ